MAPDRSSRPGGLGLPGKRNSALATAALTSVALFSQTADAAPAAGGEGPSREDVRQRVSSLYDRAESDTGLHNITRAQSAPRRRSAPAGGGRTSDPELDSIARQWFQGARASLGPTVPAILPADRRPARRAADRPTRPADPAARPGRADGGRELAAAGRPALELPAGGSAQRPVAELPAGPTAAPATSTAPSVPTVPAAALPAVPAQRTGSAMAPSANAPESKQVTLRRFKQENQRKIAAASELLYRYTARQTSAAPLPVAQPHPTALPQPPAPAWPDPAEQSRRAAEEAWRLQQPSVLDTGVPATQTWAGPESSVLDTGVRAPATWQPSVLDTGTSASQTSVAWEPSVLDTGVLPATQMWPVQDPGVLDTGALPAQDWHSPQYGVPAAAGWQAQRTGGVPVADAPAVTKADRAVAFARAQLGRPCLWGAVGPESYDNAGLTQAAWKAAGVALPRSTSEQAHAGTVVPLAESRPGDLIFFHDNFSHVGLCTGNGLMIHAPGPGSVIREESIHNAGEAAIRIAVRPA
jgi:cell wall-associated NlpC family hydrolase